MGTLKVGLVPMPAPWLKGQVVSGHMAGISALTEDWIMSLFEGRLAPYKHPRDVIFLDVLPRTSVGKPHKAALRAMASRGLERRSRTGSSHHL
jgi:acyl-CoA synthetase (AMP-forming)/AMP-acid ligase II